MAKIDLHIHTTESDGELTPSNLVRYAKSEGLDHIAITDHNEIAGCRPAIMIGKEIGVNVISGCELTVSDLFEGKKVSNHLLVYGMDQDKIDPVLFEFFEKDARAKNNQSEKICKIAQNNPIILSDGSTINPTFSELCIFVSSDKIVHWGEIGAYISHRINKLHNTTRGTTGEVVIGMYQALAIFLNGDQKYVDEYSAVLRPYIRSTIGDIGWKLDCDKELKVSLSMVDALSIATKANGIPVIAHPGEKGRMVKSDDPVDKMRSDEMYLRLLIDHGLRGIEIYSPKNNPDQKKTYSEIASRLGLLMSGGTDFHGVTYSPDKHLGYMTKRGVPDQMLIPFDEIKPLIVELDKLHG